MQFLIETTRLGLNNLKLHKLRSVLTSLGIILGVAAVIVVVAIGEGNKQSALKDIAALGATNVILRSTKPPQAQGGSQQRSLFIKYGLQDRDLRRIRESVGDAEVIVPLKAVGSEIAHGPVRTVSQAFGTTPELLDAARLQVQPRGRYITMQDMEQTRPVAVIGSEIARQLYPMQDPIGAGLKIDNQVFRVIGVLKPVGLAGGAGSALVGRDLNKDVHIPLTTAQLQFGDMVIRRELGSVSGGEMELSEIYITAPSTEAVINVSERIRRIIDIAHEKQKDVEILVPWELLEKAKRELLVWNIMLVTIAAISLVVGGIGIMNIMLASVTERTREIGIRRALGATRKHIIWQFLVETGSLAALGGVVGIILGVLVSLGMHPLVDFLSSLPYLKDSFTSNFTMQPRITAWSIVVSFLVAASVGVIFGIYPAIMASKKDPIVALRHD